MGKVGIYSLHGYGNYGNKLQNYAVEQLVVENGYEPVSLILRAHPMRGLLRDVSVVGSGLLGTSREKMKRFLKFDSECLHNVRPRSQAELNRLGTSADFTAFIAGSDQVWYCEDVEPTVDKCAFYSNRFLQFAPAEKRIALAPSFGMDELPNQWDLFYTDALRSISALSVRELSGADLVEKLTGKRPPVVADPTLGFDGKFWGKLASSGNDVRPEGGYVFGFFLGPVSAKANNQIQSEASRLGVGVVGACGDGAPLDVAGPEDFLGLIRDASCVLTDSFHCVVFSLLFHKDFYVSKRVGSPSMFGRIVTLLDGMGLEDRVLDNTGALGAVVPVDWGRVDQIISGRRKELRDFVAKALEGVSAHA